MEFISHFRLSGVGINLLIHCQIVAGSVVSSLGAERGRQAGAIPLVLQGAGSGWWAEPWQEKELMCLLPYCRKEWSSALLRQPVLHRCQVYCFWHQSNTFMSHLSCYHFFFPVVLSPL